MIRHEKEGIARGKQLSLSSIKNNNFIKKNQKMTTEFNGQKD